MFLFNSESIKSVIILDKYDGHFVAQRKFPILGIKSNGGYIFKKTKKLCNFLKENNISFVEG